MIKSLWVFVFLLLFFSKSVLAVNNCLFFMEAIISEYEKKSNKKLNLRLDIEENIKGIQELMAATHYL